jgi:hypothetical protein
MIRRKIVKRSIKTLIIVFVVMSLSACTYNIQPSVVTIPQSTLGAPHQLNCKALLLIPQEFANREYVSSFEGREVRLLVGPPAMESIDTLLRSRFAQLEKRSVSGDGTLDFMQLASMQRSTALIVIRPRFVRLESSVRPFRYNIEIALVLDLAGLSQPATSQGHGIGTAGLYTEASIQKAADEALSQAIISLTSNLPTTCEETGRGSF